ncbi:hypothetical protein C5167_016082 [Papaver somniferum]|uniref:putative F-box protein At3g16210 n=1 Tax=Papaver somniferum TaxID=3469 RepID=UPI000E700003|nr:putative F-box protein At3g16210 [Papaver somniferum]RZC88290.1 hypothetical protein C5167_016082 [Papaver somniferum]
METIKPSANLRSHRISHEEFLSIKIEIVLGGDTNKVITEHLPIDLVVEILCRLPIKSLSVFKCVSKSWNKLISQVCIPRITADACVIKLYSGYVKRFCYSFSLSDKMPEVNYVGSVPKNRDKNDNYHEIDCCNGLSLYKDSQSCYGTRYVVADLATNQCFTIPEPLEHVKSNYVALAFDPVESNGYKVVLPLSYLDSPSLDVFSSDTGKWTRHTVPGDWIKYLFVSQCHPHYYEGVKWTKKTVYLDGILYVLTVKQCLVLFDLKSPTVSAQVIKVPCASHRTGFIGNSRGVLYYTNYDKEYRLSMWQFDYHSTTGNFWILKHCICINDLLDKNQAILHTMNLGNHQPGCLFEPYGIHPLSDIIFLALQGRIYTYHLGSQKCELVWKPARTLSWRSDFIYPSLYSYINVKDFRNADRPYLSFKQVSDDGTVDPHGGGHYI